MLGERSALPPIIHGTRSMIALSALPPEERVASPLGSAGYAFSPASQPAGRSPRQSVSSSVASSGCAVRYAAHFASHAARAVAPRAPIFSAKRSRTPAGTRNLGSVGQR